MASKKRKDTTQITKETAEEQERQELQSTKKRVQQKKRRGEEDSSSVEESDDQPKPTPQFDFGVETAEPSTFKFDWESKQDEKQEDTSASGEATSEAKDETGSTGWNFSWSPGDGQPSTFQSIIPRAEAGTGEESGFQWGSSSFQVGSSSDTFPESTPSPSAQIFKDKKAEDSGTGEDKTLHRVRSKVYVLREKKEPSKEASGDSDEKKENAEDKQSDGKRTDVVEIGHGDLHVNTFEEQGKLRARLVLRMDKTQRLVLNAPIYSGMEYRIEGEKFIRFISFGLEAEPKLYLLKFKTKNEAIEVKTQMDICMKRITGEEGDNAESSETTEAGEATTEGGEAPEAEAAEAAPEGEGGGE